ncbi:MAG: ABC transporter permease [Gammaproteobacteria bacterium]
MNLTGFLESISRDFRRALRGLPRRPAFTIAAVLTLALGIGATTAIFSVVYSVLLKPLPFPNPDELVRIRHPAPGVGAPDLLASPTMLFTYRKENRSFTELGMFSNGGETFTNNGETTRLRSLRVTHGVLQSLGVQPLRGRWFTEQEHGPTAEGLAPVMLSYAFWRSNFGGAEAALGREMLINGRRSHVVGIMPADFRFLDMSPQPDIIVALQFDPAKVAIDGFWLDAVARLRPGVTPAEAHTDVARMLPIWLNAWPVLPQLNFTKEGIQKWRISPTVQPLKDDLVGGVASTLWLLMGAIGAVLLVACANIANLMLVRADARRQEFAVRAALGAVPARIARELFIESLVIAALGGALGLALAYAGIEVLRSLGPSNLPRLGEIAVYPPVLLFTAAVALASTVVFGSVTALKHAGYTNVGALGGSARGASAGRERARARNTLVVVQVAVALVLVVSAVLMIRTFQALHNVDAGFVDPGSIQTVRTWTPNELLRDAKQATRLQHEILDAIAALPGVESAGFTHSLPMEGAPFLTTNPVSIEGRPVLDGETPPPRRMKFVSPGYFQAMGTRILAGRDMSWADIEAGGRVVLISENFARELAPTLQAALGMRLRSPVNTDAWRDVIGVVQDLKDDGLYADAPSLTYWPVQMEDFFGNKVVGGPPVAYVVRSQRTGTASLVNEIHSAVWSINESVPIALERTMQALYGGSLARTSFTLVMLAIAGGLALALGLLGIYGVISYIVSQRSREIGIRLALGAEPRDVGRMFVRHGLLLASVGIAIGLVVALAVTRLMSSLLFGVAPTDPVAYLAALGVILAAAALASYLPARRAAAIDPVETLKAE